MDKQKQPVTVITPHITHTSFSVDEAADNDNDLWREDETMILVRDSILSTYQAIIQDIDDRPVATYNC